MPRLVRLVPVVLLVAACEAQAPITRGDTEVAASSQVWQNGPLRLASNAFAGAPGLTVVVDGSVLAPPDVTPVGTDALDVWGYWALGWHTVAVQVGERTPPEQAFEVHGFTDRGTPTSVPLWGVPLAFGQGSSKFWVGTSRGLSVLDARWPAQEPELVDSTVDVSCLASIGVSVGGGVVTADRGCGTLRARRYGALTSEVDSGPWAAGWRQAINGRSGVWLLEASDSVGLAVRQPDGAWRWVIHLWSDSADRVEWGAEDRRPVVSPDGRLAVAGRMHWSRMGSDLMVFDLERGALLWRQDSGPGPAVAFSPTSDTIVGIQDSSLVLLDSRTGRLLARFAMARPFGQWGGHYGPYGPLEWDPYSPWLYAWHPNGCPALLAIDRRTWSTAGQFAGGMSDIPECDGAIAVSGFTRSGWVLHIGGHHHPAPSVHSFTIPDP